MEVLDYAFEQITGVGFFETLQVLKGADYLGSEWYDDTVGFIQQSKYFPELAQASGDFANTIDDLDVLEDVARPGVGDFSAPQIFSANSQEVASNFLHKWGNPSKTPLSGKPTGSWTATAPDGTVLTRYPSSIRDPGRWTLQFRRSDGSIVKVRCGG
jgi:hypothetical protein